MTTVSFYPSQLAMRTLKTRCFSEGILFKGTVMQIEKALINDGLRFQKYPENFTFQLFIIFQ